MGRKVNKELSDKVRQMDFDSEYIPFFDATYFEGRQNGDVYGYDSYLVCKNILDRWSMMLMQFFKPTSVLDVGAAYGFVVKHFRDVGIRAEGIEPSEFARNQAKLRYDIDLHNAYLPNIPDLGRFDLVTATEVMEHMPVDLVPQALQALARSAEKYIVTLIFTGNEDEYQDDPSHINPRPADWWIARFKELEDFEVDWDSMMKLNGHSYSQEMAWTGRFFVAKRKQ